MSDMQPLTVSVSINTRSEGVRIAAVIREIDETAEVLLHEAKRGNGWSITAHMCASREKAQKLRETFRVLGVIGAVREAK